MKKFGALVTLLFVTASVSAQGIGWRMVNAEIQHKFGDVPRLTTAQLAQWLAEKKKPQPILLDVRTAPEFEISHLAGARRVDPEATAAQLHLPNDKPIVTYCSVGYRSAALAQRLRAAGFTNVENLEGSIFQWANENRPLVHDGQPTDQVHPYNAFWGALLDKDHRAPVK